MSEENKARIVGWICPVCGKGVAPFTMSCPCVDTQQAKPFIDPFQPYGPTKYPPYWELPDRWVLTAPVQPMKVIYSDGTETI